MVDQSFLEHVFGAEAAENDDDAATSQDRRAPLTLSSAISALPQATAAPIREVGDRDDDVIRGTGDDDILLGLAGNDRLIGRAGDDTLNGAVGDDRLQGGGGDDLMIGGGGDDSLFGGGGGDNIRGGGGNDTIRGGGGNDTIRGNGGSDTIRGNGGDDSIIGGGGADTIIAGPGNDTIKGGGGNDVFIFSNNDINRSPETTIKAFQFGRDTVDLSAITGLGPFSNLDLMDSAAGAVLTVNGNTILFQGRRSADFDADDFNLDDNSPPDPFLGTAGNDALTSGPGSDLIQGLAGNDTLGAGVGQDTLIGGAGQDIFVVRVENGAIDPTVDIVRDFSYTGGDRVGLTEALNGISFDALEDVVRVTPTDGDSVVAVDRGAGFQDVLRLEGVTFQTRDLVSYGFTAPPVNSTAFVENPYGFQNRTLASANPRITGDGVYVLWTDQQNLDGDPNDLDPFDNVQENAVTRDAFVINTQTKAIQRVAPRDDDDRFLQTVGQGISEDGRYVAYVTSDGDAFVQDMAFPETAPVQINVAEDGEIADGGTPFLNDSNSGGLAGSRRNESASVVDISGDGRKVAFVSSRQLSEADTNNSRDVYLRDLDAGTTTLISQLDGAAAGGVGFRNDVLRISQDGRYIAFSSTVALVEGEQDGGQFSSGANDVYLFDTVTGRTILVSSPLEGGVGGFDMSADGSRIAFATDEAIAADDTNEQSDIYVADIDLASFTVTSQKRVSEAEGGFEIVDSDSFAPVISPDGARVAFLNTGVGVTNLASTAVFDGNDSPASGPLFIVDVDTGRFSGPPTAIAQGPSEGSTNHVAFSDDSFVYREATTGANNNRPSDTLIIRDPVALVFEDIPDGTTPDVQRGTTFRSEIDAPGDVDIFRLDTTGDSRTFFFSVEGVDTGAGTLADPKLSLFNGGLGRDPIVFDDNNGIGRNEVGDTFIGAFSRIFIQVESADGGVGSYSVTVDRNPPEDLLI